MRWMLLLLAAAALVGAEPVATTPLASASATSAAAAPAPVAGSSLVLNGDLEKADPTDPARPLGWDRVDGLGVQWVAVPDGLGGHGKAIRLDTAISEQAMVAQWTKQGMTDWVFPKPAANAIAETYGLSLYSAAMPVEAGRAYRVTVRYHGSGGAKVWVRGYGLKAGKERRLYESQGQCPAAAKEWGEFTHDIHPTRNTPGVTTVKVMLYAYYPPGVSWFDDVKLEPLAAEAGPPPVLDKDLRKQLDKEQGDVAPRAK